MSAEALFWIGSVLLVLTAIANLGYRALHDFSRRELEAICRRTGKTDRFGEILRLHDTVALGVEMLASLFTAASGVALALGAAVHWDFLARPTAMHLALTSLGVGALLVLVRTWTPWALARLFGEGFLCYSWPAWRAVGALTAPLLIGAKVVDATLHRLFGRSPPVVDEQDVEEEIRAIMSEGHRGGLLEEEARDMIEGVIELGDADVAHIMTPRTEMHTVHVEMPFKDIVADVIDAGHTRVPVYDKTRDDIIGILYSKDLLPELATGDADSQTPLRQLVRKPVFVPQTKAVDDLLQMFQQMRTHIAIVLDEYGGVAGLVTIEDVLEEIVGEIIDEYDPEEEAEIDVVGEGVCEALGRAHIDEINERLELELPEDGDFDTIGGFVFSEFGRIPQAGESLAWQDTVRVDVLEATKRRIDRVRITRLEKNSRLESA